MPIDFDRKLIFIHVPRTGGTSIESLLGLMRLQNLWSPMVEPQVPSVRPSPQHLTCRQLRQNVGALFFETAYKFAFVRNPWDRFVSEFHWCRKVHTERGLQDSTLDKRHLETLEAFVRVLELVKDGRIDKYSGFDAHLEPQVSFVTDEGGRMAVDFVGRYERFEGDLNVVFKNLRIGIRNIPHLNRTRRNRYQYYYSSYSKTAVESFYREDIEAFGYVFGNGK